MLAGNVSLFRHVCFVCLLPQVKALLADGLNKPRKGSDAGDHPPITPMRAASEGELGGEHSILKLILMGLKSPVIAT